MNEIIIISALSIAVFFFIKQLLPKPDNSEISPEIYRKNTVKDSFLCGLVVCITMSLCKYIAPLNRITFESKSKVKSATAFTKPADF